MKTIYVSQNKEKNGAFATVTDALASIPEQNTDPVRLLVEPGIYHEKITINRPCLTVEGTGHSSADTILTYDDHARAPMPDIGKLGTFRSYSVFIDTHDVTVRNLTIENASGDSLTHGQAIALYADGDRLIFDRCRLLGHQDTLFTGPLPLEEIEPNGFIGPKQSAPRINGRQYYKNCYICGDIDFIFGSATAYFENCTIESLRRTPDRSRTDDNDAVPDIQGYITAASTPHGQEYGYVFSHCSIISKNCPAGSVYLGRPWRDYAKTVFTECALGAHIHEEGFHDWHKTSARNTVLYAEYKNYPLGYTYRDCSGGSCRPFPHRADFVYELDAGQAAHFSRENVLSGSDHWHP